MSFYIDGLFFVVLFSCTGTLAMLAVDARPFLASLHADCAIIGALLMLQSCIFCGFCFFAYKLFDLLRYVMCVRYRTVIQDEELLILMDIMNANDAAMDNDDAPRKNAPDDTLSLPYAAVRTVLQQRNRLLVNTYLVASGIFFAVFSVCFLDSGTLTAFLLGSALLAIRDAMLRAHVMPVCMNHQLSADVHKVATIAEGIAVSLTFATACLTVFVPQFSSAHDENSLHHHLLQLACFFCPILLWMAPTDHHAMVVLEASIPVATLISIVTLYVFSPVAPYVEGVVRTRELWGYMGAVPVLLPGTLLSFLYIVRRGLALGAINVLLFWLIVSMVLTTHPRETRTWYSVLVTMVSFVFSVLAFLWDYRRRNILAHSSHGKAVAAPVAAQRATRDFGDIEDYDQDSERSPGAHSFHDGTRECERGVREQDPQQRETGTDQDTDPVHNARVT